MVFPKARIAVAALLVVGWLGYLLVLVAMTRDPVVLSRPQILVSNLIVLAKIDAHEGGPNPRVHVKKVLWSADDDKELEGRELLLEDLVDIGKEQGWAGATEYLVPLMARKIGRGVVYEVTPLPNMPGFVPANPTERRIYRATDDAMRQFWQLKPS